MITIKTSEDDNVEITVEKGTPHLTVLLGIEALIEILMKESGANLNIDDLLKDLKQIYERDNSEENE